MALRRYTRPTDGSIPVQALLYDDEELLAHQGSVGIYDGLQKSTNHQVGTVYVSTHRLFYIDMRNSASQSFALDLSYVTQTEYYAGLFKSSPKVTLHLSGSPAGSVSTTFESGLEGWECKVCAYRNRPGLSPAAGGACGLCGVPRTAVPAPTPSRQFSSLPSLGVSLSVHQDEDGKLIACSACTFLNHPRQRTCEICSTDLSYSHRELKSAPASSRESPVMYNSDDDADVLIKVSFRKGGDKAFYAVLKRSLKSKAWAMPSNPMNIPNSAKGGIPQDRYATSRSGISGILRTVETSAQGRDSNLKDALQDLEALMIKAKDMVRLAAELNEKLTASSSGGTAPAASSVVEPEEATFIRSSLSQLGLHMPNAPVTLDMMKDERRWFDELARELATVLQGKSYGSPGKGLMKERGIIALDEVWGGWNRARGVALIPPATFLKMIPYLPMHTRPEILMRTFTSGLRVLHTPPYTHASFAERVVEKLVLSGPKTTYELACEEGLTVGLTWEMIGPVETDGGVCRDDPACAIAGGGSGTVGEARWWANVYVDYVWDGQV